MYFIEIFQAFTGRLPEVDDLIANIAGFLVGYLTAQGFLELFDKKAYKYGIIRILSTVILLYFYICSVLLGKWGCITGRGGSICEDDGTIWYGTQVGKVENCAKKM